MILNHSQQEESQMKPEYGIFDVIVNVALMATLAAVIVIF